MNLLPKCCKFAHRFVIYSAVLGGMFAVSAGLFQPAPARAAQVIIDGKVLSEPLISDVLKFDYLANTMFHGQRVTFGQYSKENRDKVVSRLIARELLAREGQRRGIKVSQEELDAHISGRVRVYNNIESFKSMLGSVDMTMEDFVRISEHALMARKYVEKEIYPGAASAEKVRTCYLENIDFYTTPEKKHFAYITLTFNLEPPEKIMATLEKGMRGVKNAADLKPLVDDYNQRFGKEALISVKDEHEATGQETRFPWNRMWKLSSNLEPGQTAVFKHSELENYYGFLLKSVDKEFVIPMEEVKKGICSKPALNNKAVEEKVAKLKAEAKIQYVP